MKVTIDVANRKEGELIKRALADKEVRAFVIVCGAVLPLGPRARARVFNFVADLVDEQLIKEESEDERRA